MTPLSLSNVLPPPAAAQNPFGQTSQGAPPPFESFPAQPLLSQGCGMQRSSASPSQIRFRTIPRGTERYLEFNAVPDAVELAMRLAGNRDRCFRMDDLAREAPSQPNAIDPSTVRVWSDLVNYIRRYLSGETCRTVFYDGPYHLETLLIRDWLLRLNTDAIITLDSQPGLVCVSDQFIQMPYVQIAGEVESLQYILSQMSLARGGRWIGCVMYSDSGIRPLDTSVLTAWSEIGTCGTIILGVTPPEGGNREEWANFLTYCFTDEFFSDIEGILADLNSEKSAYFFNK